MSFCKKCNRFMLFGDHKCPPIFEIFYEDYHGEDESECEEIFADSEKEAVEKWAEIFDQRGDYTIIGGEDAILKVRKRGSDLWKAFIVHGASVPEYWAEPKIG